MFNSAEIVIRASLVVAKSDSFYRYSVALFICAVLLLQSSLAFAELSATFRITHKVSNYELTPAYSGHDESNRSIGAWSSAGTGDDKSFRWYFDQVVDAGGVATGFFYIHNLETGLVLTRNPEDNEVTNWGRVEGDQAQQWRLVSSANDGSVMIINRAYDQGLIQEFGGADPDKHVVATFPGYENQTGGFSWYLAGVGDADLTKLHIGNVKCEIPSKGTDGATLVLTLALDLLTKNKLHITDALNTIQGETAVKTLMYTLADLRSLMSQEDKLAFQKALDGDYSTTDDVFIDINGRRIWPSGGNVNMGQNQVEDINTVFIYENKFGANMRIEEYDYASDNDHLGEQLINPRLPDSPSNKLYSEAAFFDLEHERSFYTADIAVSDFRAIDPTRPLNVELVIEGEQGLASGTIEISPAPVNGLYPNGTTVILEAKPAELSEFVSWEGVSDGINLEFSCQTTPVCSIVVAEDTLVKPVFRQMPRLVVDNLFAGNTVTFSPEGIPCASVGYACQFYATGTEVSMTVMAGANRAFSHWEGEEDCKDGVVTLTDTLRCIPKFDRTDYILAVEASVGVTVTGDSGAIDCGADCEASYPASAGAKTVLLTAAPATGQTFVGWAGTSDCRDEDENDNNIFTTQVTVGTKDVSCNVVAYAAGTKFSLTVQKQGGGFVKAEALPFTDSSGIDCVLDACSQNYPLLTDVQLTATATRGSKFAGFATQVGSTTFSGDVSENVCFDGQVAMSTDIICIATFTSSALVIDGSNDDVPKESNEYIAALQLIGGLDNDIWSVKSPTSTSNPAGRAEPNAADLAKYGRVIWYSGDANANAGAGSPAAGPSPAAEASLSVYLDGGGCFMLSSPEYGRDRAQTGLTSFAQTYLGVSEINPDVTETHVRGAGLSTLGFSQLASNIGVNPPNPFNFHNSAIGNLADSVIHNPAVPGSDVIFKYRDGGTEAGVAVDNDVYRSVFLGFPFLGLNSGNDRNNVMKAFIDFCEQPERDDLLEPNDDFAGAFARQGFLSQKALIRMPRNDDFLHWTATNAFANTTFSITFVHEAGDLSLEVYDSTQTLVGRSQSQRNIEDVFIADVAAGQVYYIRVFGQNDVPVPYVLDIASDGDRDHDGVVDSKDDLPDDPNEQFDTDRDLIGNKADLDDDNDGMPDDYEIANGFNPLLATSASGDEDLDGFTNLEEYMAGTDPLDANSKPEAPVVTDPPVETDPPVATDPPLETDPPVVTDPQVETDIPASTGGGGGSVNIWTLFVLLLATVTARRSVSLR